MPFSGNLGPTPNDVAISLDGSLILAAGRWSDTGVPLDGDGDLRFYDAATGELVHTIQLGTRLGGMDLSPDGSFLVITERAPSNSATVYKVDLATGQAEAFTLLGDPFAQAFYDVAVLFDGTVLLTISEANSGNTETKILDLSTGEFTDGPWTGTSSFLSASPDGSQVLIGHFNSSDAPIALYDAASGGTINHGSYEDGVMGFNRGVQAFSQTSGFVAQAVVGKLYVYDAGLNFIRELTGAQGPLGDHYVDGVGFSSTGEYLYVRDSQAQAILQISTLNWAVVGTIPLTAQLIGPGDFGNRLLLSPDGSYFTVQTSTGLLVVPNTTVGWTIAGTSAGETLDGTTGHDTIEAREGNDQINGGEGDDVISGGAGNDTIAGGSGSDTASYGSAVSAVSVDLGLTASQNTGGAGLDTLSGVENIYGSAFNDSLFGNAEANVINGQAGNDLLVGGAGDDRINGGAGTDTLDYSREAGSGSVFINVSDYAISFDVGTIASYQASDSFGSIDTLSSIEHFITGAGDDEIFGGFASEVFETGAGNDWIIAGGGDDILMGGSGVDFLRGEAGNDTILGTAAELSGDTISGLAAGDRIIISDANLANFTFNISGSTLTYTGGTLKLAGPFSGPLVASAAAGGGVQLTSVRDVANDFNGDGRSDIMFRHDNGAITNFLGTANGGILNNGDNVYTVVGSAWSLAGTGDFNGDGRDDVLWRNSSGAIFNFLGTANGGVQNNGDNSFLQLNAGWTVSGIGDFNGDGRDDILFRDSNGVIFDYLGVASGGFFGNTNNLYTDIGDEWHVSGVGDFNGDGRDDILFRNDNGAITNFLGTLNGGILNNGDYIYTVVDNAWHIAGVGDFNGDGRDDILWRNDNGAVFTVLSTVNGGIVNNGDNSYAAMSNVWHVEAIGDYNGDGRDDILWRHDNGTIIDWLGTASGGFTDNSGNLYTSIALAWQVAPADALI